VESFVAVGFTAHSELVKEMTTFMLTERADPEQVRALEAKVKSLNVEVTALQNENDEFKMAQDDIKKRLGDLINAFTQSKAQKKGGKVKGEPKVDG
jgi:regulator of replication initiation timing